LQFILYVNNFATRFIVIHVCGPLVSPYVTMYYLRLCPRMARHYAQQIDALRYQRYDYEYRLERIKLSKIIS
jgi:hypothetical protein